jgi:hypothetical protein
MVLCQYLVLFLVLFYPIAFIAVIASFVRGRGRRWTWGAFGLLVLPVLVALLLTRHQDEARQWWYVLRVVVVVGLFGMLRHILTWWRDLAASGTEEK